MQCDLDTYTTGFFGWNDVPISRDRLEELYLCLLIDFSDGKPKLRKFQDVCGCMSHIKLYLQGFEFDYSFLRECGILNERNELRFPELRKIFFSLMLNPGYELFGHYPRLPGGNRKLLEEQLLHKAQEMHMQRHLEKAA